MSKWSVILDRLKGKDIKKNVGEIKSGIVYQKQSNLTLFDKNNNLILSLYEVIQSDDQYLSVHEQFLGWWNSGSPYWSVNYDNLPHSSFVLREIIGRFEIFVTNVEIKQ